MKNSREPRYTNAKRATRPNPRTDKSPRLVVDNTPKKIQLLPRNLAQERYIDVLEDASKSIVFATGPAGTGKTLLATLWALRELRAGNITKIVLTRPAVSVDEQHGFLPGDIQAKMMPWLAPIIDVLKEHYNPATITKMLEEEVIEIAPLAYMRGRTFKNSIVLFDEAQNALPSQMKMVLTRLGENARMIITGDMEQHDRGFSDNGLKDFLARLERKPSPHVALAKFESSHVERHPAIEDILDLYDLV